MRIAVLTNYHLEQVGGAEEALDRLASAWHAAGHDVTLLASPARRSGARRSWSPAYPVVRIRAPWSTRFGLGHYARTLAALHRQCPLDVVLASDAYWPGHAARLFWRNSGVPYGIYSHGSDVMHGSRFLARPACRRRIEDIVREAASVACISQYMRGQIESLAPPRRLVRVIHNGWPDEWATDTNGGQPSRPTAAWRYILALGRVIEGKGFQTLIDAAAKLRRERPDFAEVGLVIAGDGPYRQTLFERATALGLAPGAELPSAELPSAPGQRPGVYLPGMVQGDAKRRLIDEAMLGACPSIRQEPQGMVVLEMLCRGVPVVASRTGGLPDLIQPGVNGLLFTSGDAADLAAALGRAWDAQGSLAAWSIAARKSVAHLRWSDVAARHLELLREAVAASACSLGGQGAGRPHFLARWRPTRGTGVAADGAGRETV